MFVNALMYNNHEYDVYAMAQEMCTDALSTIEVRRGVILLAVLAMVSGRVAAVSVFELFYIALL